MATFAVVDLSNLFHRARRSGQMSDPETNLGLTLLIVFRSLRKLQRELKTDHIVFAIDQGSWRYHAYPAYKSRRKLHRLAATPTEKAETALFFEGLNKLVDYLQTQTRCTVLQATDIEGDDFVAGWIARHPQDRHVIVSGDSDFVQLIAKNVRIYDAINQRLLAHDQITNENGHPLAFTVSPKDGKIKVGHIDRDFIPEPQWWRKALFIKLLRGDVGDSVFSAYPGVRYEGKKCSIRAAWDDRIEQGYDWNNLMFQEWKKLLIDANGDAAHETVRVIDEYRINVGLIDLTQQPETVRRTINETIDIALAKPLPSHVGVGFLRYCGQHDLPSLAKETDHVVYLNAAYPLKETICLKP
jgi:5'-3' exonuclease, N-terminal resolvase-like domain